MVIAWPFKLYMFYGIFWPFVMFLYHWQYSLKFKGVKPRISQEPFHWFVVRVKWAVFLYGINFYCREYSSRLSLLFFNINKLSYYVIFRKDSCTTDFSFLPRCRLVPISWGGKLAVSLIALLQFFFLFIWCHKFF